MTPNDVADVEYPTRNGSRQDGRNLIGRQINGV